MKLIIITIISFLFVACAAEPDQKTKLDQKPQSSTMFDTQLDALEKAKGVEQSLEDAAEKREKEMRKKGT